MRSIISLNLNYENPIKLAEGVFWVGFADPGSNLHCNPYLIIDEGEGVLIDGGSRPDFSSVMMKISQTGMAPGGISTLIYQHYDPDLCGSIPNLEGIIDRPDLKIISHRENNIFIKYYAVKAKLHCIQTMGYEYTLRSGRVLKFVRTPYAHSAGSFVTFDPKSGILFTSDLLGSYEEKEWELFFSLNKECAGCMNDEPLNPDFKQCKTIGGACPLPGLFNFHRVIMTSNAALRHALDITEALSPQMAAPQHGSVLTNGEDIKFVINKLRQLKDIGIDGVT